MKRRPVQKLMDELPAVVCSIFVFVWIGGGLIVVSSKVYHRYAPSILATAPRGGER